MKIVFLTAGAAGMYCGSCMHDNSLAKAMRDLGHDVLLQPIYTPIRTDETSIATQELFFGGIHMYLLQQYPFLGRLPRFMRSWLDRPGIIRAATRRAVQTDPAKLGEMTLSMLRGEHGRQSEEVARLVDWLADDIVPDAIVYSNLLIGGSIPAIDKRLPATKHIVILQGDDIFLDHLPNDHRDSVIAEMSRLSKHVDHFVTHSNFYRDKMSDMLGLDESRFQVHPLSIDFKPFQLAESIRTADKPKGEFRIGYMARIAPEKGLHTLVDAFIGLAKDDAFGHLTLHAAGWLGEHNHAYFQELRQRLEVAGLSDRFRYHGQPTLNEKVRLMHSFDVLSVPTSYEDPKGLFVLEALASGAAVFQPAHGAFPELLASTGGGECFPPGDSAALAELFKRHSIRKGQSPAPQDDSGNSERNVMARLRGLARHSIAQEAERLVALCQ